MRGRLLAVLLLLAACAASGVAACARATAQPPANQPAPALTRAEEDRIGAEADRELRREGGNPPEGALHREAQQAAGRLAAAFGTPASDWHVAVLDFAAPNAFALPGGHVYVTRGLFPYLSNEDQLAAVLAHEMAHVALGDAKADYLAGLDPLPADLGVFRPVARLLAGRLSPAVPCALFAAHDEDRERAVNGRAAAALRAAGFDPEALDDVLETLDRLDLDTDERGVPFWGLTHGRGNEIDLSTVPAARAGKPSRTTRPNAFEFLERLRGLLFGDDPRIGLVRVDKFTMPNQRIAMTVPDGWDVSSDRMMMIAASPNQDAFILLQRVPRLLPVAETASALAARAGLGLAADERLTINGLAATAVTTTATVERLGEARVRLVAIMTPHGEFAAAGVADVGDYAGFDRLFASAIGSVREMTAAEAGSVFPERIALETAGPDETWDRVARRHGGLVMGNLLAILNHGAPDQPVPAGETIKVVVAAEK